MSVGVTEKFYQANRTIHSASSFTSDCVTETRSHATRLIHYLFRNYPTRKGLNNDLPSIGSRHFRFLRLCNSVLYCYHITVCSVNLAITELFYCILVTFPENLQWISSIPDDEKKNNNGYEFEIVFRSWFSIIIKVNFHTYLYIS